MDNYSKVLEFFMENGITLNKEQIEELKEEFLGESRGFRDAGFYGFTKEKKLYDPKNIKKLRSGNSTESIKKLDSYMDDLLRSDSKEKEEFLGEAAIDPVKSDFNKFKKAWSFNNPAIIIKFEADCYNDEDMYNFGGYDVHDYPAFKKLKSDASRDELVQVVNNDFYAKFEKAIEKINKVISGTVEIEGDWDTGNIIYRK